MKSKVSNKKSSETQGQRNVTSGHLERIRGLPQTKAGQQRVGRAAVESGQLEAIRNLPQTLLAHILNGRQAVATGQLVRAATYEGRAKGARKSNHIQWHLRRGIFNPRCEHCY